MRQILRSLTVSFMSVLRRGPGRRGASVQPVCPTMLWCDPEDSSGGALETLEHCLQDMVDATKDTQKMSIYQSTHINNIYSFRNSQTMNRTETSNSVPFSLVSPDAYISDLCVKVHNPLEASGWFLERVYYKVKQAEEGLVNVVLQSMTGEKPVAIEETEEMLRVGSTMTGFGEVVLEGGMEMRLQAPRDGRKYILVPTDHRSFIDRHESSAHLWKSLTVITGFIGASLLASVISSLRKKDDR